LWHIDIKGPFFIQLERHRYLKTWIYGLVDDHSRYVLGLHVATGREIAPILAWLRRCIELCGRPIDLMTDNGVEFAHWMPGLLNRFGKTLRELEIRQSRTHSDPPRTSGRGSDSASVSTASRSLRDSRRHDSTSTSWPARRQVPTISPLTRTAPGHTRDGHSALRRRASGTSSSRSTPRRRKYASPL